MNSHLTNILENLFFKIDELVKEEKSLEGFSIFSSGGHLVQQSGMV